MLVATVIAHLPLVVFRTYHRSRGGRSERRTPPDRRPLRRYAPVEVCGSRTSARVPALALAAAATVFTLVLIAIAYSWTVGPALPADSPQLVAVQTIDDPGASAGQAPAYAPSLRAREHNSRQVSAGKRERHGEYDGDD